jgi:hypothetical protein
MNAFDNRRRKGGSSGPPFVGADNVNFFAAECIYLILGG